MNNPQQLASLCPDPGGSTQKPRIVASGIQRKPGFNAVPQRFKIREFINPRTHSVSYRVSGTTRAGVHVRENFKDSAAAQARQMELEAEFIGHLQNVTLRATSLSADQLKLAELTVLKLGDDWMQMLEAAEAFSRAKRPGKSGAAPLLGAAVDDYIAWLDNSGFRAATIKHWKVRMRVFKAGMPEVRVDEISHEHLEAFLRGRQVGAVAKDTDRRAVSRFFSWCKERPRYWVTANPCAEVRVALPRREKPPEILSPVQCEALLRAAIEFEDGILVPYIVLCLFGGLRPFEAARLERRQVNLQDKEIRIDDWQSKVGGRVVAMPAVLAGWLKEYSGPVFPKNWRKLFAEVRKRSRIQAWPVDVLRHTAISHHFRRHMSYGLAAEQFGNSERIIKQNYQGRVTTEDTAKFYGLTVGKCWAAGCCVG